MADFLALQELTALGLNTAFGPLASYTPTWATTGTAPDIGNGTLAGRYARVKDDLVFFYVSFRAGTTTTFGTGSWSFSLPFNVSQPVFVDYHWLGQVIDAGTAEYVVFAGFSGPNLFIPRSGAPLAPVTSTSPMTWSAANQDRLFVSGFFWATA